jgi:DNA (cytosine-5)-methyltransferase 1
MFRFVDLFSGCGGLSLGIRAANGTEVLAVERALGAANTFYSNMTKPPKGVRSFDEYLKLSRDEQIAAGLLVAGVETLLGETPWTPADGRRVDAVVGGPPCQGFSLAGRRNKNDARNELVWTFLQLVDNLDPKFVVIENVEGMNHRFLEEDNDEAAPAESTFSQVLKALAGTGSGYVVNGLGVDAAHYGAPQHRPRLMAFGIRKDVAEKLGVEVQGTIWRSHFKDNVVDVPKFAPIPTTAERDRRTVRDAIGDLLLDTAPIAARSPYYEEISNYGAWKLPKPIGASVQNHEKRNHRPLTRLRFLVAQKLAELHANSRLLGPMSLEGREKAMMELRREIDSKGIDFAYDSDTGTIAVRTFEQFADLLNELANNKHSQRVLDWTEPARTVMTIPDDHIHPSEARTFTVREMARFQGFPDAFVFEGKVTTGGTSRRLEVPQYSQVGNAVSPYVGKAVGALISRLQSEYEEAMETNAQPLATIPAS